MEDKNPFEKKKKNLLRKKNPFATPFFLKLVTKKKTFQNPPGFHTTAQELQTCTFEGSQQRGKKERNFGRSGGRGVWRRGSLGERPYLRRTHENFEVTPHRHTTPHHTTPHHTTTQHNTTQHNNNDTPHNTTGGSQGGLGQGGSLAGRSMPQIVPKSSPIGQGFWGQGFWAKSGAGQGGQKNQQTRKKDTKKSLSPSPKTKNKMKKQKNRKKTQKSKKWKNLSPPPSQTKKSKN